MAFLLSLINGIPQIKFSLGESDTIGRSSECEIQLLTPMLSRRHARIRRHKSKYRLEDMKSRNGTFLNGARLDAPAPLKDGDEIGVGDHTFVFNPPVDVLYERSGDKSVYLVKEDHLPHLNSQYDTLGEAPEKVDHESLLAIHHLTCEVMSELDLDLLLNKLMDRLMTYFSADRGLMLSYRKSGRRIRPLVVRTEKSAMAISHTLLKKAVKEKGPILIPDALENLSFQAGMSVVEHQLRSVMLVPLMTGKEVIGFIQLDKGQKGAFDHGSLARLSLLSEGAALALQNADRFEREKRKALSFPDQDPGRAGFVTRDPKVLDLLDKARKVASSSAKVLVTGESGTGKELVARMIHELSPRAPHPWIAVNCAAVPENLLESELFGHEKGAFTGAGKLKKGCFELADNGTLFLDEVGDVSPAIQVKLLRAIQENTFFRVGGERPVEVDIRIVAATNQDLKKKTSEGSFREDLYYRLHVIALHIPPLRERKEDVERLTRFFLERFGRQLGKPVPGISEGALTLLAEYSWPGNVRELQNVMERIMVLTDGGPVTEMDLPPDMISLDLPPDMISLDLRQSPPTGSLHEALAGIEKEMLCRALRKTRWKKVAAARMLGISRPTLDKKINQYRIEL